MSIKNILDSIADEINENYDFLHSGANNSTKYICEEINLTLNKKPAEPKGISFSELQAAFDPKGLILEINKRVGAKLSNLTVSFDMIQYSNSKTALGLIVSADPITGNMLGVMQSVITEAKIGTDHTTFNSEKMMVGATIHSRWKHQGGGSNGYNIVRAFFDFNKKSWGFYDA